MVAKKLSAPNVTKTRLLDATEALFIKYGYDAVLLRQITERAQVNLAAVNYHFGDKDSLMKTLLMQRLEPLTVTMVPAQRIAFRRAVEAN